MHNLKESAIGVRSALQIATMLAFVVLAACAPQGSQSSPELAAMSDRFSQALNSGNLEMLMAMYTSDCRVLPPNAPMEQGLTAARAEFGKMVDAGMNIELNTLEATVAGDIGYRVGTYSLFGPDGSPVDSGKFIDVWRKTAAGWQTSNDMWSSDLPADAGKTYISVTHEVKDKDLWLAAWQGPNSRKQMFAEHGVGDVKVFVSPDDPHRIGLLLEVTDMDALMAFMATPEAAAAEAEDGVIVSTLRFMTEVK
jgi:ketosteroid isomerase-like protein